MSPIGQLHQHAHQVELLRAQKEREIQRIFSSTAALTPEQTERVKLLMAEINLAEAAHLLEEDLNSKIRSDGSIAEEDAAAFAAAVLAFSEQNRVQNQNRPMRRASSRPSQPTPASAASAGSGSGSTLNAFSSNASPGDSGGLFSMAFRVSTNLYGGGGGGGSATTTTTNTTMNPAAAAAAGREDGTSVPDALENTVL